MTEVHAHALPSGTRLDSFEITDILGTGSFGITYKATDHTLKRVVAIKEYLPSGLAYRESDSITLAPVSGTSEQSYSWGLQRFLEEARVLARFNEPSIIRVIRYLEANGTAYFVMDYLAGRSLYQRIQQSRMSEAEARALLMPLLKGLGTVHDNHYLHRDIKPHNIYLRDDGFPILLDFGCARQHLGQASRTMTVMGSPAYAPFEQLYDGDKPLPSADIYSLAATVFHCISGRPPPASTRRITAQHASDTDPLKDDLEDIAGTEAFSEEFLDVLDWMLSPYPADRPQTTADVMAALEGGDLNELRKTSHAKLQAQRVCTDDMATMPVDFSVPPARDAVAGWDETLLQDLEAIMARYIGPRSLELVRGVAERHHEPGPLVDELAAHVTTPEKQLAFRQRVREVTGLEIIVEQPVRHGLGPEQLDRIKDQLAESLGPIAGVLVKRCAASAPDRETFLRRLADELPDDQSGSAFLDSMRRL